MTRIQSSTGLITGIPIEETVNKLMAVASQPATLIANRNQRLKSEQLAVTQLSSLLVALQFEAQQFGSASLFDSTTATSSDPSALAAAAASGKTPTVGKYVFTPLQTASAQQLLSQGFAADEALGAGTVTFGSGGHLDRGIALAELNDGGGVRSGKIRITDRSGETVTIDLSFVRTVDDVLAAINDNSVVSVSAVAVGDKFKLVDNSGGAGNLKVQEVAGGTTAADLGLAGIDVAASTALGADVLALYADTKLASLNDGTGVQLRSGNDLLISLADESTLNIDLGTAKTLGEVIDALNAAAPAKLSAAIAADGNRIELTDLTTGSGTFAVTNVGEGTAARDLGLTTAASGDTTTGARLASGLRDTLVYSLRGGEGLGTLGVVDVTNRNGVTSNIDLSNAETLGEIIDAFNTQGVGFTASVNAARNGILLADSTGATVSNFIISNGDANDTATALGIAQSAAANKTNSGSLDRRQISEATLLSSLNGGAGIDVGDFLITDTNGSVGAIDLDRSGNVATTVGDVIARINALTIGVQARINDHGDGIVLIDTTAGAGKLKVREVGNGTTAKDLRILGDSTELEIDGAPQQAIDGTATWSVAVDADDKLADVVEKINTLNRGVTASIVNDGNTQRLSLSVDKTGVVNELLIDSSDSALVFDEISRAQDALLLYGTASSSGGGVQITSSTNEFKGVVDGIDLTLNEGTAEAVTVTVKSSSASLVNNAKEFVAAYNSLRTNLDQVTDFNEEDLTTGILFGSRETLRVEADLSHVITSRFFGVGGFQSLEAVGISLDDKGKMKLDETKLNAAFTNDPEGLKKLFTDENLGVAKKLDTAIEQLAGANGSLLSTRTETLGDVIDANSKRIEAMTELLTRQRERLLMEFYRIESTVAKLQDNLTALSALQIIPPLTSSSNR